jgi:hypothetical protein
MGTKRWLRWLWVPTLLLLLAAWGCESPHTLADRTQVPPDCDAPSPADAGEAAFWESLPLPDDAEVIPVVEGIGLGFTTRMAEPELFDLYAMWLDQEGWKRQAPTEAMVTLPHQRWRRNGTELLIEIRGVDEQDRTIVWLQLNDV